MLDLLLLYTSQRCTSLPMEVQSITCWDLNSPTGHNRRAPYSSSTRHSEVTFVLTSHQI